MSMVASYTMEEIMSNCSLSSSSYEGDKAYVFLASTTAILSFFLNLSQFIVIIHQQLLKTNKNIIIINLCVCGQLSSASVIWYIYKVVTFWQEERLVDDYLLCFLLPSGLHLLTIFTFTPLITLLVLQHNLIVRPRMCKGFQSNHLVIGLLIVLAWCHAIIISIIPLTGWNNWNGLCSFPLAWSSSFSVLICIIYFLHYPMVLILLADLCVLNTKRRNSISPQPLCDQSKLELCHVTRIEEKPLSNRNIVLLFLLYIGGTMPFMCYTASVAMDQDMDICDSLVANEKAAMWTSWVTVVFAAIRPLFHILVEDDLGDGTAIFITTVCRMKNINA